MLNVTKRHPVLAGVSAVLLFTVVNVSAYVLAWSYFFEAVHGTIHNVIIAGLLAVVLVEVATAVASAVLGVIVLIIIVIGAAVFVTRRRRR
jgi:hypothetical protein